MQTQMEYMEGPWNLGLSRGYIVPYSGAKKNNRTTMLFWVLGLVFVVVS